MNKGELKASVISEIGSDVEDMLEAAQLDEAGQVRSARSLQDISQKILKLSEEATKDLDAGGFSNLEPLEVLAIVKKYIVRCSTLVELKSRETFNNSIVCRGRVQALKIVVNNLQKKRELELKKASARKEREEGSVGVGPTIKSIRNGDGVGCGEGKGELQEVCSEEDGIGDCSCDTDACDCDGIEVEEECEQEEEKE